MKYLILVAAISSLAVPAAAQQVDPKIAKTCAQFAPVTPLFISRFGNDPDLMALIAACTPDGQVQMTKNDKLPISPSNSGNSAKWASHIMSDGYLSTNPGKRK